MATTTKKKKFDPDKHLTDIKGKPYLPVQWRLVWFREEHPDWSIQTKIVKMVDNGAIFQAKIVDGDTVVAMAHKMETKAGFGDYLEKAETGAIGRALAMCGYGTQFSPDLYEGERLADSPVKTVEASSGAVSVTNTTDRPSEKQMKYIRALYKEKSLSVAGAKGLLKMKYKIDSHKKMTKAIASDWIKFLQEMNNKEILDVGDDDHSVLVEAPEVDENDIDFDDLDFTAANLIKEDLDD